MANTRLQNKLIGLLIFNGRHKWWPKGDQYKSPRSQIYFFSSISSSTSNLEIMLGKVIIFSLFFVLESGQCTSCRDTSQYCVSTTCTDVVYDYFVDDAAPTASISAPYAEFHVGMISDIQFYFINCKEQPAWCIMDPPGNTKQKKTRLDEAADRQSQCVDTLRISNPFDSLLTEAISPIPQLKGRKQNMKTFWALCQIFRLLWFLVRIYIKVCM